MTPDWKKILAFGFGYVFVQAIAATLVFSSGPKLGLKPTDLVSGCAATVAFLGGLYASLVTLYGVYLKFRADSSLEFQRQQGAKELEARRSLATMIQGFRGKLDELRQSCEAVHNSLKHCETGDWDHSKYLPIHERVRLLYPLMDDLQQFGVLSDQSCLHQFHQRANFICESITNVGREKMVNFWRSKDGQDYVRSYDALREEFRLANEKLSGVSEIPDFASRV